MAGKLKENSVMLVKVDWLKDIKDELSDIKITGYDNLEMLKKILVELQELNEDLAMLKGQG